MILKIHVFDLNCTDHNIKYTVESQELLVRKLLSIQIERRKCVKASKHAKNMFFFWQKMCIFTQISERSTCMHLQHSDLDSVGQRYLGMTKKFSAPIGWIWVFANHKLRNKCGVIKQNQSEVGQIQFPFV